MSLRPLSTGTQLNQISISHFLQVEWHLSFTAAECGNILVRWIFSANVKNLSPKPMRLRLFYLSITHVYQTHLCQSHWFMLSIRNPNQRTRALKGHFMTSQIWNRTPWPIRKPGQPDNDARRNRNCWRHVEKAECDTIHTVLGKTDVILNSVICRIGRLGTTRALECVTCDYDERSRFGFADLRQYSVTSLCNRRLLRSNGKRWQ